MKFLRLLLLAFACLPARAEEPPLTILAASSLTEVLTGQYMMNHRAVQNTIPLDARHTNIAFEVRKAGYEVIHPREEAGATAEPDRKAEELKSLRLSLAFAAVFTLPLFVLEMGSHFIPVTGIPDHRGPYEPSAYA